MKYEKWSWAYELFRPYIVFAHWLIYRKVVVVGKNKLPKGKPLILAPNHQNALSDALAVLCNQPFQPVWLARADLFERKFTRPILRFMKIMPAYRIRDGKENLGNNTEIFEKSIKVLENNGVIALFPEGAYSWKRKMLPHKKAIARIVFPAEERNGFNLDIKIIPVGLTYSHYWHLGRKLLINIGDPINVLDYKKVYEENQHKATLTLRDDIFKAIAGLTLEINSETYYDEINLIRDLFGKTFLENSGQKNNILNRLRTEQQLAEKLQLLEQQSPDGMKSLTKKVLTFAEHLQKLKIRNWLLDKNQSGLMKFFLNLFTLVVTSPLFLYGFVLNFIPFTLLDRIIRKKVPNIVFWGTFFFAAGILLFPIVYLTEVYLLSPLLHGIWLKLAFLASLPLSGKAAYIWYIGLLKTLGRCRLIIFRSKNSSEFKYLNSLREEISENLKNAANPWPA